MNNKMKDQVKLIVCVLAMGVVIDAAILCALIFGVR